MDPFPESEAPFNMAVATLMRLDNILQQIRNMSIVNINIVERQKIYLDLVKQFFLNSIPLLDEDYVTDNKGKIMDMKMKKHLTANNGKQVNKEYYDDGLQGELDRIMIEIQQKLKRFFMPSGKDPRRAVEF